MRVLASRSALFKLLILTVILQLAASSANAQEAQTKKASGQKSREEEVRLGSQTAKGGFQNEDEIRDKFNDWQKDSDARKWLEAMNYRLNEIEQVKAAKPHGEKADVEVRVKTKSGEKVHGISIKLVSNPQGFNQIDKRWLKTYADMWKMPDDVHSALKLFVGETAPINPGRDTRRMFLNELPESQQQAVVRFFSSHRGQIVSDLFAGDGEHAAGWIMVTLKTTDNAAEGKKSLAADKKRLSTPSMNSTQAAEKPQWMLCTTVDAVAFFGDGEVEITPAGSLKIGRITMQRKGGDNGRESANMLQFKINPTELFELRK
ncbi:MAG: type II restriction endonuclease [Planctomycetota bacterium]|nr:type II restriction endonuclease [Planctomycetota bacterium]